MSYLDLSLFLHSGVQHILCFVSVLFFLVLCTHVASLSVLSIFYCPSVFSYVYLIKLVTLRSKIKDCFIRLHSDYIGSNTGRGAR